MLSESQDVGEQDLGNILALEHVNVRIPDQVVATTFYVVGLGLTRDPDLMVGTDNMWANVGQQQFHLPTGAPQILRGHVGLVLPDLEALEKRLHAVEGPLRGTQFGHGRQDGCVVVTSPWGNRIRCHAPGGPFGDMRLGIPYVQFDVEPGRARGIASFYERALGAPAMVTAEDGAAVARVRVGVHQELVFRETPDPPAAYDGHHVAIYVSNFTGPYRWLKAHGLITEESSGVQYRFQDIADVETGQPLFTIEHEVRSATHPMYMRPLVNRNPAQRQATYMRGRDAFVP